MTSFPKVLESAVLKSFVDQKAYGQVSTVSALGVPSVRTVHLHYVVDGDFFAFNTHVLSKKVSDLRANAKISGCFWDEKNQKQFRMIADAEILDEKTDGEFMQRLWLTMRDETRLAYVLESQGIDYDADLDGDHSVERRVPRHTVVAFRPHQWDIHAFSDRGYRFGKTTRYIRHADGGWHDELTNLIY